MTEPNRNPDAERDDYLSTLRAIANHTPTCSEESETAWSQRVWASLFRDLQRMARDAMNRHGQKP